MEKKKTSKWISVLMCKIKIRTIDQGIKFLYDIHRGVSCLFYSSSLLNER